MKKSQQQTKLRLGLKVFVFALIFAIGFSAVAGLGIGRFLGGGSVSAVDFEESESGVTSAAALTNWDATTNPNAYYGYGGLANYTIALAPDNYSLAIAPDGNGSTTYKRVAALNDGSGLNAESGNDTFLSRGGSGSGNEINACAEVNGSAYGLANSGGIGSFIVTNVNRCTIIVDLGTPRWVIGLLHYGRTGSSANGRISTYDIYTSLQEGEGTGVYADINWSNLNNLYTSGTNPTALNNYFTLIGSSSAGHANFPNFDTTVNATGKTDKVIFPTARKVRYVALRVKSTTGTNSQYLACAELQILGASETTTEATGVATSSGNGTQFSAKGSVDFSTITDIDVSSAKYYTHQTASDPPSSNTEVYSVHKLTNNTQTMESYSGYSINFTGAVKDALVAGRITSVSVNIRYSAYTVIGGATSWLYWSALWNSTTPGLASTNPNATDIDATSPLVRQRSSNTGASGTRPNYGMDSTTLKEMWVTIPGATLAANPNLYFLISAQVYRNSTTSSNRYANTWIDGVSVAYTYAKADEIRVGSRHDYGGVGYSASGKVTGTGIAGNLATSAGYVTAAAAVNFPTATDMKATYTYTATSDNGSYFQMYWSDQYTKNTQTITVGRWQFATPSARTSDQPGGSGVFVLIDAIFAPFAPAQGGTSFTYNGSPQSPTVAETITMLALVGHESRGDTYGAIDSKTWSGANSAGTAYSSTSSAPTDAGSYTLTVQSKASGSGEYNGSYVINFTIAKANPVTRRVNPGFGTSLNNNEYYYMYGVNDTVASGSGGSIAGKINWTTVAQASIDGGSTNWIKKDGAYYHVATFDPLAGQTSWTGGSTWVYYTVTYSPYNTIGDGFNGTVNWTINYNPITFSVAVAVDKVYVSAAGAATDVAGLGTLDSRESYTYGTLYSAIASGYQTKLTSAFATAVTNDTPTPKIALSAEQAAFLAWYAGDKLSLVDNAAVSGDPYYGVKAGGAFYSVTFAESTNLKVTLNASKYIEFKINPKTLTGVTVNGQSKTYDGSATASYTANYTLTFTGIVSGDSLTYNTDFTVTSATYSGVNAGTGYTISVSGIALTSTQNANNYVLDTAAQSGTSGSVNINKVDLTVAFKTSASVTKTYDGGVTVKIGVNVVTASDIWGLLELTAGGFVNNSGVLVHSWADVFGYGSFVYDNENVSAYSKATLTLTSINSNYNINGGGGLTFDLPKSATKATISPINITIDRVLAPTIQKEYDKGTAVKVGTTAVDGSNIVWGDYLSVTSGDFLAGQGFGTILSFGGFVYDKVNVSGVNGATKATLSTSATNTNQNYNVINTNGGYTFEWAVSSTVKINPYILTEALKPISVIIGATKPTAATAYGIDGDEVAGSIAWTGTIIESTLYLEISDGGTYYVLFTSSDSNYTVSDSGTYANRLSLTLTVGRKEITITQIADVVKAYDTGTGTPLNLGTMGTYLEVEFAGNDGFITLFSVSTAAAYVNANAGNPNVTITLRFLKAASYILTVDGTVYDSGMPYITLTLAGEITPLFVTSLQAATAAALDDIDSFAVTANGSYGQTITGTVNLKAAIPVVGRDIFAVSDGGNYTVTFTPSSDTNYKVTVDLSLDLMVTKAKAGAVEISGSDLTALTLKVYDATSYVVNSGYDADWLPVMVTTASSGIDLDTYFTWTLSGTGTLTASTVKLVSAVYDNKNVGKNKTVTFTFELLDTGNWEWANGFNGTLTVNNVGEITAAAFDFAAWGIETVKESGYLGLTAAELSAAVGTGFENAIGAIIAGKTYGSYSGAPAAGVWEELLLGFTLASNAGDSDKSSDANGYLNAGDYDVTPTVAGGNITATVYGQITVTPLEYAAGNTDFYITVNSTTYTSATQFASVVISYKGILLHLGDLTAYLSYYLSAATADPINAGTYTVNIDISKGTIRNLFTGGEVYITDYIINKAKATLTANSETQTYTGTAFAIPNCTVQAIGGTAATTIKTISYDGATVSEILRAGVYTVTYSLDEASLDGNYYADDITVTVTVKKAVVTFTVTREKSKLIIEGSDYPSLAYVFNIGEGEIDGTETKVSDYKTYNVSFRFTNDEDANNYEAADVESKYLTSIFVPIGAGTGAAAATGGLLWLILALVKKRKIAEALRGKARATQLNNYAAKVENVRQTYEQDVSLKVGSNYGNQTEIKRVVKKGRKPDSRSQLDIDLVNGLKKPEVLSKQAVKKIEPIVEIKKDVTRPARKW
ncbi:MAG: YDG domain-containing protein [Clostridiales bacterium]|jgi:hypothetical protein|nr:YDG domain-containing protein [Clostridiales bacterium]